jgi:hypothetical protein
MGNTKTARRRLLVVLGGALFGWPLNEAFLEALKDGLREAGHVDGRNIVIDVRLAGLTVPQLLLLRADEVIQ